eukprot:jgi/Botrbrau1/22177/Bobra.168_1s0009.1
MSVLLFLGYALIAGGPIIIVFSAFIARKSFLVLLTLGSMFLWLTGLLVISLLLRGLLSTKAWPWSAAVALFFSVLLEESMRYALWRANRKLQGALEGLAMKRDDAGLTQEDRLLIALTHGFAQGAVHSVFFYASWLPLTLSGGTFYVDACPKMSYFLAAALLSLSFFILHTASMVLAFDALDNRLLDRHAFVVSSHLVAALLTMGNQVLNGCLFVIPLLLLLSIAAAALAAYVSWDSLSRTQEHGFRRLPSAEEEALTHS